MSKPIQLNSEAIAASGGTGTKTTYNIIAYQKGDPNKTFQLEYVDYGNGICSFRIKREDDSSTLYKVETSRTFEIVLTNYTMSCSLGEIGCVCNCGSHYQPTSLRFRDGNGLDIFFEESINDGTGVDPEFCIMVPTAVLPPPVPITAVPPGQS